MSSQVLALFDSRIWSNHPTDRIDASLNLVSYLQTAPESDVSYALKRIIRGIGSPVDSSRSGFGLALTELLRACESLQVDQVIELLKTATTKTGNKQDVDEKEMLFARLFGLHAIARAGVCFHTPALATLFNELLSLMRVKSWLQEAGAFVILDILQRFPENASQEDWDVARQSLFLETAREWHAQKLAWILFLQSANTNQFGSWEPILKGHFQNTSILLHPANLPVVGKLLKGETLDSEHGSEAQYQQLPLGLQTLLAAYTSQSLPKGSATLVETYRAVIDSTLLNTSASNHSKAAALRFAAALVLSEQIPAVQKADCLHSANTIRTLINHAQDKRAALHILARQVLGDVVDLAKRTPEAATALLRAFTTAPSSIHFDTQSMTKTVEGLVLSLEGDDVQAHITDLKARLPTQDVSAEDSEQDEEQQIERNKDYRWAIEQLLLVSRKKLMNAPSTSKSPANVDAVFDILKTLAAVKLPTPELRQLAESRSINIIADLLSSGSTCEAQCQVLEQAVDIAKKQAHTSKALKSTRKSIKAALGRLTQEDPQTFALKALCQLVTYLTYEEGEAFAGLAESVTDVITAFKAEDSSNSMSVDGEVAAEPSAVLVDYLLTLMRVTSSKEPLQPVLRTVAESVFVAFTPTLGTQAVRILQDQLVPASDDDDDEEGDAEESGSDDDESEEEEESSDEEEADEGNESDADSDLGINLDADPELRAKVEAALMGAGINAPENGDAQESDEEVLLDDDQMMALDDQLAAAFKEHVSHKTAAKDLARQDVQASQRALDLIDIYCKRQSSGKYVIELLQTLFDTATSRQPTEEGAKAHADLTAKATRIAKAICNNKPRDGFPQVQDKTKTLAGLKRIHEIVRSSSAEATLGTACALYISRMLMLTDESTTTEVVDLYRQTLKDFVYRKNSALRTDFILPFLQRGFGWDLLDDVLEAIKSDKTVTAYRRIQVVGLLQALLHANKSDTAKTAAALPAMSDTLFSLLLKSGDYTPPALNAPRTKEVLKTIMALARVAPAEELQSIQSKALAYSEQVKAENGNPGSRDLALQISKMGVRGEKRKQSDSQGSSKKQKV